MADPRLGVNFEGLAAEYASFLIDNSTITYSASTAGGSAGVGLAVTLSADDTIALAADADAIIGKLWSVGPDGVATVQVKGFMTLPGGTGASLTRGKTIVGDLLVAAKGYIRETDTATAAELGKGRGQIIRNGTTTAVVVAL